MSLHSCKGRLLQLNIRLSKGANTAGACSMTRPEVPLTGVRFQFEGLKGRSAPPVGIDAAHNLQNHEEQGYHQRNDQLCLDLYRTQRSRCHYSRSVNLFHKG